MSDATAGAQRNMEWAFILPLAGQITQTKGPVSQDPNVIATVDSRFSPPKTQRSCERTKINTINTNECFISFNISCWRWTYQVLARTGFEIQKALNTNWFQSIWFAGRSRNRWRQKGRRRKEKEGKNFSTGEHSTRAVVKFHWCQINFRIIWKFN